MIKRLQLSDELHLLLRENDYPENVYFQAPSTVNMDYPCIRYSREDCMSLYADNKRYIKQDKWLLTVIDANPDSLIPDILLKHFKYITPGKVYTSNNLNHFPFILFY